jgi:hypothetical protein
VIENDGPGPEWRIARMTNRVRLFVARFFIGRGLAAVIPA